jgi:hypothetical protein
VREIGDGGEPVHDAHGVHVGKAIEDLEGISPNKTWFQSRGGRCIDDLLQVP